MFVLIKLTEFCFGMSVMGAKGLQAARQHCRSSAARLSCCRSCCCNHNDENLQQRLLQYNDESYAAAMACTQLPLVADVFFIFHIALAKTAEQRATLFVMTASVKQLTLVMLHCGERILLGLKKRGFGAGKINVSIKILLFCFHRCLYIHPLAAGIWGQS